MSTSSNLVANRYYVEFENLNLASGACSSADQSIGLRNRGSWVRIPPGAPEQCYEIEQGVVGINPSLPIYPSYPTEFVPSCGLAGVIKIPF